MFLLVTAPALAFQPSPTTPYGYSTSSSDFHQHHKVGDGFWHYPSCNQSGPPLYFCSCSIGAPGDLTPPKLTLTNGVLEVEYFVRNAYCNPPADGGDPNRPNSQNYYIDVISIAPEGGASTFSVIAPYWEHGKVILNVGISCNRYQAVLRLSYFGCGSFCLERAGSKIAGPAEQDALARPCPDLRSCPLKVSAGKPINVGSGNMRYEETLFSIAENTSPLSFALTYNSRATATGPLGPGFRHTFAQTMKSLGGSAFRVEWVNGKGERTIFYSPDSANVPFSAVWPAEATGTVTLNSGTGTYELKDLDGNVTTFGSASGEWRSTRDRWNNTISGAYTGSDLTTLTDPEGRVWTLAYTAGKLSSITAPDSRVWTFTYNGTGHLEKVVDPFHTVATPWRTHTYVTGFASDPLVLASVADGSGVVLEGHEYDTAGRAISSWSGATSVVGGVPHPTSSSRDLVTIAYDSATQTTVTNKIDATTNSVSTFTLAARGGRFLPLSIVGNCPSCGAAEDSSVYTYDDFNYPLTEIVGIGTEQVQTSWTYNANRMVLTRVNAVDKPRAADGDLRLRQSRLARLCDLDHGGLGG